MNKILNNKLIKILCTLTILFVLAIPAFAAGFSWNKSKEGFVKTGNLIEKRSEHTATLLQDGRVLITGGNWPSTEATAELYAPKIGKYRLTCNMNKIRSEHTATLLQDGRILITGGYNSFSSNNYRLKSAEIYDPKIEKFTLIGDMNFARYNHTATLLKDGRVLIVGGSESKTAELFDPLTNKFYLTGSLNIQREDLHKNHTATLLPNGKVLIIGGANLSNKWTNTVEMYDPDKGKFIIVGHLIQTRKGHVAILLPDGKILLVGGEGGDHKKGTFCISSAEIYDPESNKSELTGSMNENREGHTAILLPNGKVLVVGGTRNFRDLYEKAEVYDPKTGKFLFTKTELRQRGGHTAVLLQDGRVLISGGGNPAGNLKSSLLYYPIPRVESIK